MPFDVVAKREYDRARYIEIKAERKAQKPKDAIETLTSEELSYIAGLIDGEGSIFIGAVGPQRSRTLYRHLVVAMTHFGVIQWLAERLDAVTVKNHNKTRAREAHPHWKDQYRVGVFGKRAQLLCSLLLPYLKVKHEQARLVTTFPCDARIGPGIKIERSIINEVRYRLRDEINALNR